MIQRIQSLLLILAFLLDGSVFFNAIYTHALNDPQAWINIIFTVALIVAALASLGCIFLYSNRQNQAKWLTFTLIPQLITLGFAIGIFISLGGFGTYLWDETIGVGLLVVALILQIWARKKVKDDIKLVKSMDRIR